jgi:hypothetical protein
MPERPLETMLKRADREATQREVDLEAILVRQLRELIAARWLLVSRKRSTLRVRRRALGRTRCSWLTTSRAYATTSSARSKGDDRAAGGPFLT